MVDYFEKYERWKSFLRHLPREEWDAAIENLEWLVGWTLRVAERKKGQEPPAGPDGSNSVC